MMELFLALRKMKLLTATVKAGASIIFVATKSTMWVSDTQLCTVFFTTEWKAALQQASAKSLLTTAWITDITFVSTLDTVVSLASPKRHTAAYFRKAELLAIYLCTEVFNLPNDAKGVSRVLGGGAFFKHGTVKMVSDVVSSSVLGSAVPNSYISACNKQCVVGEFPSARTELVAAAARPALQSPTCRLLIAVMPSLHLCRRVVIVE